MAVRLVGQALPSAPLVDSISRFTPQFEIINSAPVVAAAVELPMAGLHLRAGQNDGFVVQTQLPALWQTMNITLSWANVSTSTGAPTFRADTLQHAVGDILAGSGADTSVTGANYSSDTATTEYVRIDSMISTNVIVDPTRLLVCRVFRLANPSDGLAGSVSAFRVLLTRAS